MEEDNRLASAKPNKESSSSYLAGVGVIIFIIGLFLNVSIAGFYLQSLNPPAHNDFASVLIAIQLQIIGLALVFAHYIKKR